MFTAHSLRSFDGRRQWPADPASLLAMTDRHGRLFDAMPPGNSQKPVSRSDDLFEPSMLVPP